MKSFSTFIMTAVLICFFSSSKAAEAFITTDKKADVVVIKEKKLRLSLFLNAGSDKGIVRAVNNLQSDFEKVTGDKPMILNQFPSLSSPLIIIGTIGTNSIIDGLIKQKKINGNELKDKNEKFIILNIKNPVKGVEEAIVIAGSDKRGTIYGIYELSRQIGVSPWYYWADVPVKQNDTIYFKKGTYTDGEPAVKYRGIFLNDEAPALSGWSKATFGGFNSQFYEKIFELMLRLKANYMWPAMWGSAFYDDDSANGPLANEMGIVMGTSHHEPMALAQTDWHRYLKKNSLPNVWNYAKNKTVLDEFWRTGIERSKKWEKIVTIGMRGDGDEAMGEGTNISLLENIVKEQRQIIEKISGQKAEKTPQIWALYKEVQDYYDKGMRVPDDVTLLLCDDNWGNIRKLPSLNAEPRKGGYGIYYHFDYVGGPRNYKWINTNQIERTWEQMNLAYQYGVDRVWIVNVGDLKPMEFPIEFFLDYAWNPANWNPDNLENYYSQWVKENFGGQFTDDIAQILKLYTKYNARRKPELLNASTYSLINYNEAEKVVSDYNALAKKAEEINNKLKPEYKDAYYQLILYPVLASANLNELYLASAKNQLYASQGRASANEYGEKVKELFQNDTELTDYYHTKMANGKWNHMMSQTHIGYTNWQQPDKNVIPETKTILLKAVSEMGIAVEGSGNWWPNAKEEALLPTFTSFENKSYYFDVFNRGSQSFTFKIDSKSEWLKFSKTNGTINKDERITVEIDWKKAPKGDSKTSFTVSGNGQSIPVFVQLKNVDLENLSGFIESNGYISIEAENYSRATASQPYQWVTIPNLGRTSSGVSLQPSNIVPLEISETSPRIEYDAYFFEKGNIKVHTYFSPTINYTTGNGLKYAISIDDETPQIINIHQDSSEKNWNMSVANNIKILSSDHIIEKSGKHTLKFYGLNSGLVLQKIVIETEKGKLKQSYLGPPESFKK